MDQKKSHGQQPQGEKGAGQPQRGSQPHPADQQQGSRPKENRDTESRPTRDQAEGSRDTTQSDMESHEGGTGKQGDKNRSGISNRGMSPGEEQSDLPSRGSSADSMDKSER